MNFEHTLYKNHKKLPAIIVKLIKKATKQTTLSYAPYSNFYVGAAILLDDGKIIGGCNQENASYPLCICAERVALNSYGTRPKNRAKIKALVVTAHYPTKPLTEPCMPCGACRQVIEEYEHRQKRPIDIYITAVGIDTVVKIKGIKTILPSAFQQENLI